MDVRTYVRADGRTDGRTYWWTDISPSNVIRSTQRSWPKNAGSLTKDQVALCNKSTKLYEYVLTMFVFQSSKNGKLRIFLKTKYRNKTNFHSCDIIFNILSNNGHYLVQSHATHSSRWRWLITNWKYGPMPNVMAAVPNIGGALCSTPQSLADAHYYSAVQ